MTAHYSTMSSSREGYYASNRSSGRNVLRRLFLNAQKLFLFTILIFLIIMSATTTEGKTKVNKKFDLKEKLRKQKRGRINRHRNPYRDPVPLSSDAVAEGYDVITHSYREAARKLYQAPRNMAVETYNGAPLVGTLDAVTLAAAGVGDLAAGTVRGVKTGIVGELPSETRQRQRGTWGVRANIAQNPIQDQVDAVGDFAYDVGSGVSALVTTPLRHANRYGAAGLVTGTICGALEAVRCVGGGAVNLAASTVETATTLPAAAMAPFQSRDANNIVRAYEK